MSNAKQINKLVLFVLYLLVAISTVNAAHAAVPDAPRDVIATEGNGTVSVAFNPPFSNGGSAITSYTATCGAANQTGASSPIVVGGLSGGVTIACIVTATNSEGTSAASPASNSVTPLLLTGVTSRKTHGTAGIFDLPIDRTKPITGLVTVEPRLIGAGHTLVYRFDGTVTSAGSATVAPFGAATTAFTSNEVLVTLTNVPDNQRVTVNLTNVNGKINVPSLAMGFLVGDVNNTRLVDTSDVAAVKAKSGTTTVSATSMLDLNASGSVSSADVTAVKVQTGKVLAVGGLTITSAAPPQPAPNVAYCHTFIASEAIPAGGWAIIAGALPPWLTLNTNRGVICGIPLLTDVGTANFTISATNTTGSGSQAVTLTVTIPAPAITQVSPTFGIVGATVTISGTAFTGATSVAIGGQTAVFTLNSATSITATVPAMAALGIGNVVVTTPGGASPIGATSAFTVTVPGANDVSIDGFTLPNPSKVAKAPPPSHGGFNGAGSYINAYAMDPTRCNTTPALQRSWQHNIDFQSYYSQVQLDIFSLSGDQALTYKITVPQTVPSAGGFTYDENLASSAIVRAVFMSVSPTPCDFDVTKVYGAANFNACYQTQTAGIGFTWQNFAAAPGGFPRCTLTPGQTYYLNIRFQDARPVSQGGLPGGTTVTSCPAPLLCGGHIIFN